MRPIQIKPRKALNGSFLKIKPNRVDIEKFKSNLLLLLGSINDHESEEFHKNLISDFLKDTYYKQNHFINTKGKNDLVIHNGNNAQTSVGVIIETKKWNNKSEMITRENLNQKAFHEIMLYFLRERIVNKNLEIKHLVISNIYEWYIFDVTIFEKLFANNKVLVKQFEDFEQGRLSGKTTDFFYNEIARTFIDQNNQDIEFTYFDIRDYYNIVSNSDKKDDHHLIALYKILSPEHLLKLPFVNDSNSLDKGFYSELLHIIGLTETKDGGKRLIQRQKPELRLSGTILEDTIIQLDSLNKINRIEKAFIYGDTKEERLFNIALTLNITWINRILFLKLLEAQLIAYHKGDRSYAFLNLKKIREYDDLNSLFFQVLAKEHTERNDDVKKLFEKVPYLNSSLFEPTELEHQTIFISNLKDEKSIPIYSSSVLKDEQGKKRTGHCSTLQYLFEFLDAYDFSSEGSEEIQEENKTLINASVLGLIFEKINGYKDGSFFTPGMITMYMCRETLRKAVLQKFNEVKNWNLSSYEELYNKIEDRNEANSIINSIKICDPAVGSGHFLVSALNELIAIKNNLKILQDKNGYRLKEYNIEVENDELVIRDEDDKLFEYNPNSKESQRVQETLFHEKQIIIEKCLFGVDINPNSVKICRLRLWIELLKNAYYKSETQLETLPNIDINIKNGNSLISQYNLDSDLKNALKKSKISIEDYKNAVSKYRNAESKEQKWELEKLIEKIKADFSTEIHNDSKEQKEYLKLKKEYYIKYEANQLFGTELSKEQQKDKKYLEEQIHKLTAHFEEIQNNKIYENAFEWRFEFPEVLDEEGNFVGFDAIIGNPPYIQLQKMGTTSDALQKEGYETFARTGDIYSLFYELGYNILKPNGVLTFITSNKWMRAAYGESLRKFFIEKTNPLVLIDFGGTQIFDTATVDTNILMFAKDKYRQQTLACIVKDKVLINLSDYVRQNANFSSFENSNSWVILSPIEKQIKEKIERIGTPLKDWNIRINYGIKTGYNEAFIIDGAKRKELIDQDPKSEEVIKPLLRGRDIKRYSYEFADLYLLFIPWHFPLHNNPNITGASLEAEKAFENQYSAIYNHLLKYKNELSNRNKAETGIRYEWYALQRWGANYWEDFSKQKIMYSDIVERLSFSLENNGSFCNNTVYFIVSEKEDLEYLLLFLNSDVIDWYYRTLSVQLGESAVRMFSIYVLNIPIPKNSNQNVYEAYNLSEEEIIFIKSISYN